MGNSPSGPRLLGGGKYCSYHIKLDNEATITVTKDQENSQKWELKYDVDGETCTLSIIRIRTTSADELLRIHVIDPCTIDFQRHVGFYVGIEKKGSGLYCNSFCYALFATKYVISSSAGVRTKYWAYGRGSRMGLFVVLVKESNEEGPNMVTVAHYFVKSGSGRNCGGDIGFSVVVKIGVHNGQLDFRVDGPVEHPSSALLYMIEEVTRTRTWTLSACPHCKNIQSQRGWLSESEDSDTPLPPPRYGGSQNAANMGQLNGDGNGSFIKANKVNFYKLWK